MCSLDFYLEGVFEVVCILLHGCCLLPAAVAFFFFFFLARGGGKFDKSMKLLVE